MFSGIPQKNRAGAESYFDEHLSQNDYYTQGETQRGQWLGIGAERLGLQPGGVVTRESFLHLCDNQHPLTGEQLTPQKFKERRVYFDFVCSPPKSVSILAVTMNDRRIIEAHKEASQLAMRELESFAASRVRKGGIQEQDRTTGNLVGAAFLHTTSRALDPQLHTHFVLFNATWDKKEGRWKALQTGDMFGAINYGTVVYRNELAKRLHQIGYVTRRTGSAFEIEGVDAKLIERFSKRSQQRDMAVKRREDKLGRKLTKKEIAHVVHQSRPKKLKGVSDEQVRDQQLGEIGFFEKRVLRQVVAAADGKPKAFAQYVRPGDALAHGLAHVFERRSVAPQHKILEAALIKGCGQLNLGRLKDQLAADDKLVRVGSEFSTREILSKELYLIRAVNAGVETVAPFVHHYEPAAHLGPDQRKALAHVLTSPDRITGFRGLAGSGKSTALLELAGIIRREGFKPLFCAPTASAADTLRKDGMDAMTLQRLHGSLAVGGRLSPGAVIVLDEAGAVGLDDMVKLFELARRDDCRVILSGDTGQHTSVPRGDSLRIIEQYSSYRFGELTTIRRQKPEAYREAVELAAAKQTDKAFAKLVELGAVTEASLGENGGREPTLYQRAADAYVSAIKQGKSALLVSPTWAEIDAVTEKVRETLKAAGVISPQDESVAVFDSLSWTVGRTMPTGFNAFTHGYAVTSHSSQGKTVEEVLLVASSKSFPAVNREQFYVSISRGRERVQIFTDDSELLARRVTDSHERKAAIELQALRDDLAKLGFNRIEQETAPPPPSTVAHHPARHFRVTRLSPVQKLAQIVEDVRRWLGLERTATVAKEQAAIADYLRGNTLTAVCILPKRYAELERNAIYISSITIKPVSK